MVRTSQRGFAGFLMQASLKRWSITAGEATGEPGVEVQSAPKPQPSGLSTLLIGRSITSLLRKMTLRCRLSAPESPVKLAMQAAPLGQSADGDHPTSGTSGMALSCD